MRGQSWESQFGSISKAGVGWKDKNTMVATRGGGMELPFHEYWLVAGWISPRSVHSVRLHLVMMFITPKELLQSSMSATVVK